MGNIINKILIVEDDVVFCKMLTRFLSKNGYEVLDAQTASQAFQHLRENEIDLAILDYRLPDANGIEILKRIKQDKPATKSILITRFTDDDLKRQADQEGVDAYISKPLDPKDLLAKIRSL